MTVFPVGGDSMPLYLNPVHIIAVRPDADSDEDRSFVRVQGYAEVHVVESCDEILSQIEAAS